MHLTTPIVFVVNILYCHANIFPDEYFSENTLTCRKTGLCNGYNFLIETVASMNECILLCHKSIKGTWSTYNPDNNFCWLFMDCPEIHENLCQNCVTNQRECDILCK